MAERKLRRKRKKRESPVRRMRGSIIALVISVVVIVGLSISLTQLGSRYGYAKDLYSESQEQHALVNEKLEQIQYEQKILETPEGERQLIRTHLHAPDEGEGLIILVNDEKSQDATQPRDTIEE